MTREEKLAELDSIPEQIKTIIAEYDAHEEAAKLRAQHEIDAARSAFEAEKQAIENRLTVNIKSIAEDRASRLNGIKTRENTLRSHTSIVEKERETESSSVETLTSTNGNENKSKSRKNKKAP